MRLVSTLLITSGLCLTAGVSFAQPAASGRQVIPVISTPKNTEFSPTISADGRTLIFESDADKKKGWQLFESKLGDNGVWSQPYPIKNINDKCNFLAGPSISYDGNTLFYTAFIEDVTQSEDIYFSTRVDEKTWSEPKSIGAPINTDELYEGFPSISADGNSLYFIRMGEENGFDKKSNEPCFTIFVSQRQADGTWGTPEALPAPINLGCERDPRIMADNHTLIFSSIREGGKGKYDLYQTRKQPDGSWSEAVALDFVNSADSDQSPCISASGDVMVFYSDKDMYSVQIPSEYRQMINITIQGFVKAEKTQKPLHAQIKVKSMKDGTEFTAESNANDGRYSLVVKAGEKYSISFTNESFVTESFELNFEKQETYLEMSKDILMRSEYILELSVVDADTKSPITTWVNFNGQKQIFKDSVHTDRYPLQLTLEAAKDYKLSVTAPGYNASNSDWKFDLMKTLPKMTQTINLEHEKIKYVASVTNISTNQKTKIKVYFKNETTGEVIVADAGDVVQLRKGDRYQIVTSSDKGFLFSSTAVTADDSKTDTEGNVVVGMSVAPIEEGAQLTLGNITFASNSSDLNASSYLELDRVIELMKTNPKLTIEISAHTDDVGSDDVNQRLSEKRALSVVRYLTSKGTTIERMRPVGFGKTKPVVPNDSDENRAKNRRVELRVLKAS